MSGRILALFAKAPVAGEVKTRLAPELSLENAARLYEAMLLDILDQHAAERDCARSLWFAPAGAADWFARHTPDGWRRLPQEGSALAARMAHLFTVHAAEGFDRIVLRGTDSPTLPGVRVAEAFAALAHAELVLCPDRDGGYNLIGLRAACDPLFALELSHAGVLSQT
ncbi:MAG: TIGR04282 family arsenosugar biosynthesis glycosyltransferase, partial [bacterium]